MVVSFVYCFVFVDGKGKGPAAMGKRLIYEKIPNTIKSTIRMIPCGDNIVWFLERSQSYICFEANPMIQCFYLALAVGGYYLYVMYGFEHVPNSYVDGYHKYISIPFMAACYWSYYMASATDPGRINKSTDDALKERALKRYGFDNILFSDKNWCKTCEIVKPARSKHCSLCNVCCEKMDHHCVWINNCVGLHNYKYFILFLFLHTGICIYGVTIGLLTAQHLIDE